MSAFICIVRIVKTPMRFYNFLEKKEVTENKIVQQVYIQSIYHCFVLPQRAFPCSKSTIKTTEQCIQSSE